MDFIIPPVNTKGVFTFMSPFNSVDKINKEEELTVISVRGLKELYNSGEKPLNTIYEVFGLSATDYKEDFDNNVPIIVFTRTNGDYYYVPADRISTYPNISGVKYREETLAIKLGPLPLDYDFTTVLNVVSDDVYDIIGIKSTASIIHSGGIVYKTDIDHKAYKQLLENRKTVEKCYKTRYEELVKINEEQAKKILALEKHITTTA